MARPSDAKEERELTDEHQLSECAECGGVTEPTRTTLDERWGGELFVFEGVPAQVCRACGEVYLSSEVAKRLEAEMQTKAHMRRRVSVPVAAYADVAA